MNLLITSFKTCSKRNTLSIQSHAVVHLVLQYDLKPPPKIFFSFINSRILDPK